MHREQIALRFPTGTKTRIKAQSQPGESMTEVILRALDGLEGAPRTPVVVLDDIEPDTEVVSLPARVDALEDRMAALEASRSDLDQSRYPDTADATNETPLHRNAPSDRDARILELTELSEIKVAEILGAEGIKCSPRTVGNVRKRFSEGKL